MEALLPKHPQQTDSGRSSSKQNVPESHSCLLECSVKSEGKDPAVLPSCLSFLVISADANHFVAPPSLVISS